MGARLVAVLMVAIALLGPIQSLAVAQQQSQAPQSPSPESQSPQPAPPQPELYQSGTQAQPEHPAERGRDAYDVGAGVMTVLGMPFKGASCALGAVVGFSLFVLTFGSADSASAAVVAEGCDQRWIVRGDDIRPEESAQARIYNRYDGGSR